MHDIIGMQMRALCEEEAILFLLLKDKKMGVIKSFQKLFKNKIDG
jgi:hypothetical protein